MKTLVSIAFAFDIPEEQLPELSRRVEESLRSSLEPVISDLPADVREEFDREFEFYGVTISLRRDLSEVGP